MSTLGVFITSGDTMSTSGGGGAIMMHVGDIKSTSGDVQYIEVFIVDQSLLSTCFLDIPRCTHGILQCTEPPPTY